MELLIRWGADVNYQTDQLVKISTNTERNEGLCGTPLAFAIAGRNHLLVDLLLSAGANVKGHVQSVTALHEACHPPQVGIVTRLLDSGADVDAWCSIYGTPLMLTLRSGNSDLMQVLIKGGANVNHRMGEATLQGYKTPMDAAIASNSVHMIELLLRNGGAIGPGQAKELEQLHALRREVIREQKHGNLTSGDNDKTWRAIANGTPYQTSDKFVADFFVGKVQGSPMGPGWPKISEKPLSKKAPLVRVGRKRAQQQQRYTPLSHIFHMPHSSWFLDRSTPPSRNASIARNNKMQQHHNNSPSPEAHMAYSAGFCTDSEPAVVSRPRLTNVVRQVGGGNKRIFNGK